ncbi:hypothetical protein [Nannocystis sp.]|uniref:hypothetical protein n=1 Tax=Nannocystis sp. TaxID=1962667 RepID=UPI0025E14208|nr:hypothetical protein [Nannocystis sp.]MBK7823693.1 hypothetical protein [Nannocystis sp.]
MPVAAGTPDLYRYLFPALAATLAISLVAGLFTPGAPLDYRMLGFQFWLADNLTAVGLEGASALFTKRGTTHKELTASTPPADDEIRRSLVENAAGLACSPPSRSRAASPTSSSPASTGRNAATRCGSSSAGGSRLTTTSCR